LTVCIPTVSPYQALQGAPANTDRIRIPQSRAYVGEVLYTLGLVCHSQDGGEGRPTPCGSLLLNGARRNGFSGEPHRGAPDS